MKCLDTKNKNDKENTNIKNDDNNGYINGEGEEPGYTYAQISLTG